MNLLYALVLLIFMDFSLLLKHSRPRFWHYLAGPMLVWYAYSFHSFDVNTIFSPIMLFDLLFFLYFLFPGNLWVYGINDIADKDTDRYNQKKEGYETKAKNSSNLWKSILVTQLLYLILVYFCMYFIITPGEFIRLIIVTLLFQFSLIIPFLALSYMYSYPPFRLKARPYRDGISNILYIITPAILFWIQGNYSSLAETSMNYWYGLGAARLRCIAMHCFSAIPDIEADTKAGVITTAVYLGKQKSLLYCIMLYAIAGMLASEVIGILGSLFGLLYCGMVMLGFRYDIFRIYKRFPYINFFVGMLLCFYVYFAL